MKKNNQSSEFLPLPLQGSSRPGGLQEGRGAGGHPRGARALTLSAPRGFQAKLAPAEITANLTEHEFTCSDLPPGPVKFFDTNSLR